MQLDIMLHHTIESVDIHVVLLSKDKTSCYISSPAVGVMSYLQITHMFTTDNSIMHLQAVSNHFSLMCLQPLVVMSNVSSMLSVLAFGCTDSYMLAMTSRLLGGITNCTFLYVTPPLSLSWQDL